MERVKVVSVPATPRCDSFLLLLPQTSSNTNQPLLSSLNSRTQGKNKGLVCPYYYKPHFAPLPIPVIYFLVSFLVSSISCEVSLVLNTKRSCNFLFNFLQINENAEMLARERERKMDGRTEDEECVSSCAPCSSACLLLCWTWFGMMLLVVGESWAGWLRVRESVVRRWRGDSSSLLKSGCSQQGPRTHSLKLLTQFIL